MDDFDITTNELEFKYDGSAIKLTDFDKWATEQGPQFRVEVSSWDVYYSPTKETPLAFEFMRLRLGSKPELTIKVKRDEKNNNNRIEIDLPLDKEKPQEYLEHVARKFCDQFGFVENFRIFKYCSIYFYDKTDLVYYISYDKDMKENGRFIEVEARKDVKFSSETEALAEVENLEKKLAVFGITPKNRMKLSQWERNRKK